MKRRFLFASLICCLGATAATAATAAEADSGKTLKVEPVLAPDPRVPPLFLAGRQPACS
jgi:hypothetical protein